MYAAKPHSPLFDSSSISFSVQQIQAIIREEVNMNYHGGGDLEFGDGNKKLDPKVLAGSKTCKAFCI